jgi:hypothetical protein
MINRKLTELYRDKFVELGNSLNEYNELINTRDSNSPNKATNPLLLKVDNSWESSDLKIMIFGQENNIWAGECGNGGVFSNKVEEVIDIYGQFYLKDKMYSCPFWNEFRRIRDSFSGRNVSVAWNNIVKIGRIGIGCIPEIHSLTVKHFNVIPQELEILKPDILIFLTGPNYDLKIQDTLGKYIIRPVDEFTSRQMGILEFEKNYNLKKCIRTYHPGYLYRNKVRRELFIKKLIEEII